MKQRATEHPTNNISGRAAPSEASRSALRIRVFGIGGAGCNAVNHLANEPLDCVEFTVLNTDSAALAHSSLQSRIILGMQSARGLGAGGDPELGRAAAEEDEERLRELCRGAQVVFVVAGLGGGTGTGGAPVLARIAREEGALVLALVILPFECEGGRRQEVALGGLQQLKETADGVICLPNQKVFRLVDEHTSLIEAFRITNELIAEGIRGIWRLLCRQGLINVDFADLCAVAQGSHSESVLASVEARGENRARDVLEKLFQHPLVDGGQALADCRGVLVCIAGGEDLAMADVTRIVDQISRHADQALVIMGAAVSEDLAGRLLVTIVGSAGPATPAIPVPARAAQPAPKPESKRLPDPLEQQFMDERPGRRPPSRFVAPPPEVSAEQAEKLLVQQGGQRPRRGNSRLRQGQLPLEIVSKGRFEKSEPTIHEGQDLDVPTYIRRGVALN